MFYELLYSSTCVSPHMNTSDLERILKGARKNNLANNITGMLLYYKGEFVQLIEGSRESVKYIFKNFILKDKKHTGINVIFEGYIISRSFKDWSMGFSGDDEPQEKAYLSTARLLMNMMSEDAKKNPKTLGVAGMIAAYDQMRKSPYR